jgi:hypothetical protein
LAGDRLGAAREAELRQLKTLRYLGALITLVCGLLSQAVPVSIFSWYVAVLDRPLSPQVRLIASNWMLIASNCI